MKGKVELKRSAEEIEKQLVRAREEGGVGYKQMRAPAPYREYSDGVIDAIEWLLGDLDEIYWA